MKQFLYLTVSLILCVFANFHPGWVLFTAVFILYSFPDISESVIWQIPMGCLITDITAIFCHDCDELLFRSLFIAPAVITSAVKPQKLLFLFPIGVLLLFAPVSDISGAFAMAGAIWSCAISVFKAPAFKFSRKYG